MAWMVGPWWARPPAQWYVECSRMGASQGNYVDIHISGYGSAGDVELYKENVLKGLCAPSPKPLWTYGAWWAVGCCLLG